MGTVNKAILVGHLGRDPETRYMPNGDCVCHINVATSEKLTDKTTGEKREVTEWHRVVLFRKLGEIAALYLKKGAHVYLEGRLQTRKWTDHKDNDRYTTEIVAEQMQMLGSRQHDYEHDERGINDGVDESDAYIDTPAGQPRQQRAAATSGTNGQQHASQANARQYTDEIPF